MKIHRSEIQIRDPFILKAEGAYYMYGTTGEDCFLCYRSADLEWFDEPVLAYGMGGGFWADREFWAPEVYLYQGKYYMLASFRSAIRRRGSQFLRSERPEGPFVPLTEEPLTPGEWDCLDATLFVDQGQPYVFFCHEWTQIGDGKICVAPISSDLTRLASEPQEILAASEAPWTTPPPGQTQDCRVTDGPFLYRAADNALIMLWSSFSEQGYAVGQARSEGGVFGPWKQIEKPLFQKDGGHAMLFYGPDGRLSLSLHQPNGPFGIAERAVFFPIEERNGLLELCVE